MFLPDNAVGVAALSEYVAQGARFKSSTESRMTSRAAIREST